MNTVSAHSQGKINSVVDDEPNSGLSRRDKSVLGCNEKLAASHSLLPHLDD
jgi:hypothetical protein